MPESVLRVFRDGRATKLEVTDLLYAHGCLCAYAFQHKQLDMWIAYRLCDVINNFQDALRPFLKPDACDFHVKDFADGFYHFVEPIGGWGDYNP